MKQGKQKGFTLVELIVVITILAILWTIAFISLQWYSRDARDSVRISDTNIMKKSLELYQLWAWKYPTPDNGLVVDYDWDTLRTQWIFWEWVVRNLSRSLSEAPLDPLTNQNYIYSLANNNTEYQILALYEWSDLANNTLINTANAAETKVYPKVSWNYNWVFLKTANYIVPTPSIINAEVDWADITLNATNIKSQVVTGQSNVPKVWNVETNSWAITNLNLSVYSGTVTSETDDATKELIMQTIQNAYSGSEIANEWTISYILDATTTDELVAVLDTVVLNTTSSTTNNGWGSTPTYSCTWTIPSSNVDTSNTSWLTADTAWQNTQSWDNCYYTCSSGFSWANCDVVTYWDWRDLDPNCDKPDVVIWTQTWAWCNSTLWTWFEFGQTNADIWTSNYSWTVWNCYNYSLSPATCTPWDVTMASDTKANTWFSGTNDNWDSEVDNIWGKYYTWANSNSACPTWYHVPSDAEWEYAEEYLFEQDWWAANCRNTTNWQLCDWTGWKSHSTSNATNNLAVKLGIPLSGIRTDRGPAFNGRGNDTHLWSSAEYDALYARGRYLNYDSEGVYRSFWFKTYGFSVRCLKD